MTDRKEEGRRVRDCPLGRRASERERAQNEWPGSQRDEVVELCVRRLSRLQRGKFHLDRLNRDTLSAVEGRLPTMDDWLPRVARAFGFLEQAGFRLIAVDDDPNMAFWMTRCRYMGPHVAVEVQASLEYQRVMASVIELADGQVPRYPIFITADDPVAWHDLHALVRLRDPVLADEIGAATGLEQFSIDRQLALFARGIEVIADEALGGERPLLRERERNLQEHARRNPPTMVVHLPADASGDEEREAIETSRRTFPEIPVVTHRYRRPSSPGTPPSKS